MSEFKNVIDGEIEKIEAERKEQQAQRAAANDRLQKAREQAKTVRDRIIIPLLNDLRDDFAAEKKKVLPTWLVQSDGKSDLFFGSAAAPSSSATGVPLPSFTIKAGAAVAEAGASLVLSVVCSCGYPDESSGIRKTTPLHDVKNFVQLLAFNEPGIRDWFHDQLEECARKCVREKLVPRQQIPA